MKMKNVLLVAILFSHSLLAMEDSIVLEESTIDQKLLELLMQKDASLVNVEELIQKGANVNVIGQGYFSEATPLVLAGLQSNIEICELLIERGAEVQVTVDENNATLLHFAATENNTPMCSLFLEKGVEVVAKDKNGCTPLMYAAMKGHKNICSLLIDHKSNVNAVDNNKLCPLLHAMSGNHLELCSYLIDNGANVNGTYQNNLTPLMFAVMSGQTDLCELLIENGAELRDFPKGLLLTLKYFEWPLLTVAAHNGYVDICSLLIKNNADVNRSFREGTPLVVATINGHINVCKLLVCKGADLNKVYATKQITRKSAIYYAILKGHKDISMLLIDNGAELNNSEALFCAAEKGKVDICKLLIDKGARVNTENHTPLIMAAKNGHTEVCILLLHEGAQLTANHNNKFSPLPFAIRGNYIETCKALAENALCIPDIENPATSRSLIKAILLCLNRCFPGLPLDLYKKILLYNKELHTHILMLLIPSINENKLIPYAFSSTVIDQLTDHTVRQLKALMTEVYETISTEEIKTLLNPETVDKVFGPMILSSLKKRVNSKKRLLSNYSQKDTL